jgi:hypothetical protein
MIGPQTGKRKSESPAGVKGKMAEVSGKKGCGKKEEEEGAGKRKRKKEGEEEVGEKALPQKKRALMESKKKSSPEEAVDDETLLRETEAALKSLSGSWPAQREAEDPAPPFENLFEGNRGAGGGSDLKEVITLHGPQHESAPRREEPPAQEGAPPRGRSPPAPPRLPPPPHHQGNELENLLKIESECATLQSHATKYNRFL